MADLKKYIFQAILSFLGVMRICTPFAPLTRGQGVIFMLHQVGQTKTDPFHPNGILNVTPQFLDEVITFVKSEGYDIIAMDDVAARLAGPKSARPFACFTLDDGYRDNLLNAYPVFKKHGVPFTVYVPTDYMDGDGDLWWLALEEAIRKANQLTLQMSGRERRFELQTPDQKNKAFKQIYAWLRPQPEASLRQIVTEVSKQAGYDGSRLCSEKVMTWDELRRLASDPLVTIGGHTRAHMALAKLSLPEARREVMEGAERLQKELGRPCQHFAFPYGDEMSAGQRDYDLLRSLGFKTAVTTRKGVIQRYHRSRLTSLPRFSLNGDYQNLRYVQVLLTGVPFALWALAERLKAAAAHLRQRRQRMVPLQTSQAR